VLLVEGDKKLKQYELLEQIEKSFGIERNTYKIESVPAEDAQRLTHQVIYFSFYKLILQKKINIPHYQWINKKDIKQLAFPKTLQNVLSQNL
jgi:hypothetical protein